MGNCRTLGLFGKEELNRSLCFIGLTTFFTAHWLGASYVCIYWWLRAGALGDCKSCTNRIHTIANSVRMALDYRFLCFRFVDVVKYKFQGLYLISE